MNTDYPDTLSFKSFESARRNHRRMEHQNPSASMSTQLMDTDDMPSAQPVYPIALNYVENSNIDKGAHQPDPTIHHQSSLAEVKGSKTQAEDCLLPHEVFLHLVQFLSKYDLMKLCRTSTFFGSTLVSCYGACRHSYNLSL